VSDQELSWNTGLSFQQTSVARDHAVAQVSIQGRQIRNATDLFTAGDYVAEPNRISAGASLGTTLFGFWPGFGNYERIRHKISPSLNWSYSPARTPRPAGQHLRLASLREQNRIGLSFNQTFEAKVATTAARPRRGTAPPVGARPPEPRPTRRRSTARTARMQRARTRRPGGAGGAWTETRASRAGCPSPGP
jgi:hypothetical protein